ncbi:cupin domain-containing protein [Devosia sp. RR2S18]|uniref:cupin domain-containing protein n=1 Tax=Devosia rhizosphaerae TaxID=3049774 RepID=UPI0032EBC7A7
MHKGNIKDTGTEIFEWGQIRWHLSEAEVSLAAGQMAVLPNQVDDLHCHPDALELAYVISGEGQQVIGDAAPFAIGPGDMFCVPRGVSHCTRNTGIGKLEILVVHSPGGAHQRVRARAAAGSSAATADQHKVWADAAKEEVSHWSTW